MDAYLWHGRLAELAAMTGISCWAVSLGIRCCTSEASFNTLSKNSQQENSNDGDQMRHAFAAFVVVSVAVDHEEIDHEKGSLADYILWLSQLSEAINCFSKENKHGEAGYGRVYKNVHENRGNREIRLDGEKVEYEGSNVMSMGGEVLNGKDGFIHWSFEWCLISLINGMGGNMNKVSEGLKDCLGKENNCHSANVNTDSVDGIGAMNEGNGNANSNNEGVDSIEAMSEGNANANSKNKGVEDVNKKEEGVVKKAIVDIQKDELSENKIATNTAAKNLVDIVNSSKLNNKLLNVPIVVSKSRNDVVIFDDELIELGSKKWNLTVCGKFIGCSMRFNEARHHIRRMWSRSGLRDVISENGVFYFKFQYEEGIKEVINNGPWMVNNKAMGFSALASSIEKPVIMDAVTTKMCVTGVGRIGFARVLVEIDVEKGIKDKIEIMYKSKNVATGTKKIVDVEYSWIPKSDGTLNDANPLKEVVSPSVIDEHVAMEVQNVGPNPPLPTQEANSAGNAPGKPSYATATGKPNGKKVNVCTLFTPGGKKLAYPVVANYVRYAWGKYGLVRSMFSSSTRLFSFQFSSMDGLDAMLENGPWFIRNNPLILKKWHLDKNLLKEDVSTVLVWVKLHGVPVTAFSEDDLSAIATKLGTPLMLGSYTSDMCMQSWGRSSYVRVMIELRADVELKDNIVMAMPKITREGHYTCNVRVEYEWKPPRCSSCKVFGHIHEECPKNTGAGEKKTVKKPSQTSRGVSVGPKMGFKPQKEYRHVPKKHNASSSGNKKKSVEPTIEVSNSNPFDVLNSVDNDVEFGTNGGTTNLVNHGSTSSGSSFMNIDNDGEFACYTPIGIVEIDSEVEVVFDETANLRISTSGKDGSDKGYGTNSLLEQWRDSYPDNDDYDPYDDDMYENHDLSEHLQSICDDLDITVRGRKKK
ncbi:nucleotide-diphospho-sugar transferase [Tanacetum coccineum]